MILHLTGLTRWYGELHVGILLELYLRTLTTRRWLMIRIVKRKEMVACSRVKCIYWISAPT